MQNFNKFALRLPGAHAVRVLARAPSQSRTFLHSCFNPSAANEKESSFRRDAESSTPGGVRSPGTSPDRNHVRAAIPILLDTGATIASRGEEPVYDLHGIIENNESEDPTEHH